MHADQRYFPASSTRPLHACASRIPLTAVRTVAKCLPAEIVQLSGTPLLPRVWSVLAVADIPNSSILKSGPPRKTGKQFVCPHITHIPVLEYIDKHTCIHGYGMQGLQECKEEARTHIPVGVWSLVTYSGVDRYHDIAHIAARAGFLSCRSKRPCFALHPTIVVRTERWFRSPPTHKHPMHHHPASHPAHSPPTQAREISNMDTFSM